VIARQPAVAAFVVGEAAEHSCLDRAAPATLDYCGGVAGAEAVLAHGALPIEVQRSWSSTPTRLRLAIVWTRPVGTCAWSPLRSPASRPSDEKKAVVSGAIPWRLHDA
jgi:hypothetical protein